MEESEAAAAACYDLDFVGSDVRFQKSLQLIMLRSQKPTLITGAKIFGLTLGTFVSVYLNMNNSYGWIFLTNNYHTLFRVVSSVALIFKTKFQAALQLTYSSAH